MKKLTVLFLFASVFGFAQTTQTQAQQIFKTAPKSLVTIDYSSYVIDGVSGKVVEMDLTLKDSMAYTIYLQFYRADSAGNFVEIPRSGMNADREDFTNGVMAAIPVGTPDSFVQTQVNNIMKAMLTALPNAKWQAYNAIMTGYGAALLPLSEQ